MILLIESAVAPVGKDPVAATVIKRESIRALWACMFATCRGDARDQFMIEYKLRRRWKPAEIVAWCQHHPPPVFATTKQFFQCWANFVDRLMRAECLANV